MSEQTIDFPDRGTAAAEPGTHDTRTVDGGSSTQQEQLLGAIGAEQRLSLPHDREESRKAAMNRWKLRVRVSFLTLANECASFSEWWISFFTIFYMLCFLPAYLESQSGSFTDHLAAIRTSQRGGVWLRVYLQLLLFFSRLIGPSGDFLSTYAYFSRLLLFTVLTIMFCVCVFCFAPRSHLCTRICAFLVPVIEFFGLISVRIDGYLFRVGWMSFRSQKELTGIALPAPTVIIVLIFCVFQGMFSFWIVVRLNSILHFKWINKQRGAFSQRAPRQLSHAMFQLFAGLMSSLFNRDNASQNATQTQGNSLSLTDITSIRADYRLLQSHQTLICNFTLGLGLPVFVVSILYDILILLMISTTLCLGSMRRRFRQLNQFSIVFTHLVPVLTLIFIPLVIKTLGIVTDHHMGAFVPAVSCASGPFVRSTPFEGIFASNGSIPAGTNSFLSREIFEVVFDEKVQPVRHPQIHGSFIDFLASDPCQIYFISIIIAFFGACSLSFCAATVSVLLRPVFLRYSYLRVQKLLDCVFAAGPHLLVELRRLEAQYEPKENWVEGEQCATAVGGHCYAVGYPPQLQSAAIPACLDPQPSSSAIPRVRSRGSFVGRTMQANGQDDYYAPPNRDMYTRADDFPLPQHHSRVHVSQSQILGLLLMFDMRATSFDFAALVALTQAIVVGNKQFHVFLRCPQVLDFGSRSCHSIVRQLCLATAVTLPAVCHSMECTKSNFLSGNSPVAEILRGCIKDTGQERVSPCVPLLTRFSYSNLFCRSDGLQLSPLPFIWLTGRAGANNLTTPRHESEFLSSVRERGVIKDIGLRDGFSWQKILNGIFLPLSAVLLPILRHRRLFLLHSYYSTAVDVSALLFEVAFAATNSAGDLGCCAFYSATQQQSNQPVLRAGKPHNVHDAQRCATAGDEWSFISEVNPLFGDKHISGVELQNRVIVDDYTILARLFGRRQASYWAARIASVGRKAGQWAEEYQTFLAPHIQSLIKQMTRYPNPRQAAWTFQCAIRELQQDDCLNRYFRIIFRFMGGYFDQELTDACIACDIDDVSAASRCCHRRFAMSEDSLFQGHDRGWRTSGLAWAQPTERNPISAINATLTAIDPNLQVHTSKQIDNSVFRANSDRVFQSSDTSEREFTPHVDSHIHCLGHSVHPLTQTGEMVLNHLENLVLGSIVTMRAFQVLQNLLECGSPVFQFRDQSDAKVHQKKSQHIIPVFIGHFEAEIKNNEDHKDQSESEDTTSLLHQPSDQCRFVPSSSLNAHSIEFGPRFRDSAVDAAQSRPVFATVGYSPENLAFRTNTKMEGLLRFKQLSVRQKYMLFCTPFWLGPLGEPVIVEQLHYMFSEFVGPSYFWDWDSGYSQIDETEHAIAWSQLQEVGLTDFGVNEHVWSLHQLLQQYQAKMRSFRQITLALFSGLVIMPIVCIIQFAQRRNGEVLLPGSLLATNTLGDLGLLLSQSGVQDSWRVSVGEELVYPVIRYEVSSLVAAQQANAIFPSFKSVPFYHLQTFTGSMLENAGLVLDCASKDVAQRCHDRLAPVSNYVGVTTLILSGSSISASAIGDAVRLVASSRSDTSGRVSSGPPVFAIGFMDALHSLKLESISFSWLYYGGELSFHHRYASGVLSVVVGFLAFVCLITAVYVQFSLYQRSSIYVAHQGMAQVMLARQLTSTVEEAIRRLPSLVPSFIPSHLQQIGSIFTLDSAKKAVRRRQSESGGISEDETPRAKLREHTASNIVSYSRIRARALYSLGGTQHLSHEEPESDLPSPPEVNRARLITAIWPVFFFAICLIFQQSANRYMEHDALTAIYPHPRDSLPISEVPLGQGLANLVNARRLIDQQMAVSTAGLDFTMQVVSVFSSVTPLAELLAFNNGLRSPCDKALRLQFIDYNRRWVECNAAMQDSLWALTTQLNGASSMLRGSPIDGAVSELISSLSLIFHYSAIMLRFSLISATSPSNNGTPWEFLQHHMLEKLNYSLSGDGISPLIVDLGSTRIGGTGEDELISLNSEVLGKRLGRGVVADTLALMPTDSLIDTHRTVFERDNGSTFASDFVVSPLVDQAWQDTERAAASLGFTSSMLLRQTSERFSGLIFVDEEHSTHKLLVMQALCTTCFYLATTLRRGARRSSLVRSLNIVFLIFSFLFFVSTVVLDGISRSLQSVIMRAATSISAASESISTALFVTFIPYAARQMQITATYHRLVGLADASLNSILGLSVLAGTVNIEPPGFLVPNLEPNNEMKLKNAVRRYLDNQRDLMDMGWCISEQFQRDGLTLEQAVPYTVSASRCDNLLNSAGFPDWRADPRGTALSVHWGDASSQTVGLRTFLDDISRVVDDHFHYLESRAAVVHGIRSVSSLILILVIIVQDFITMFSAVILGDSPFITGGRYTNIIRTVTSNAQDSDESDPEEILARLSAALYTPLVWTRNPTDRGVIAEVSNSEKSTLFGRLAISRRYQLALPPGAALRPQADTRSDVASALRTLVLTACWIPSFTGTDGPRIPAVTTATLGQSMLLAREIRSKRLEIMPWYRMRRYERASWLWVVSVVLALAILLVVVISIMYSTENTIISVMRSLKLALDSVIFTVLGVAANGVTPIIPPLQRIAGNRDLSVQLSDLSEGLRRLVRMPIFMDVGHADMAAWAQMIGRLTQWDHEAEFLMNNAMQLVDVVDQYQELTISGQPLLSSYRTHAYLQALDLFHLEQFHELLTTGRTLLSDLSSASAMVSLMHTSQRHAAHYISSALLYIALLCCTCFYLVYYFGKFFGARRVSAVLV